MVDDHDALLKRLQARGVIADSANTLRASFGRLNGRKLPETPEPLAPKPQPEVIMRDEKATPFFDGAPYIPLSKPRHQKDIPPPTSTSTRSVNLNTKLLPQYPIERIEDKLYSIPDLGTLFGNVNSVVYLIGAIDKRPFKEIDYVQGKAVRDFLLETIDMVSLYDLLEFSRQKTDLKSSDIIAAFRKDLSTENSESTFPQYLLNYSLRPSPIHLVPRVVWKQVQGLFRAQIQPMYGSDFRRDPFNRINNVRDLFYQFDFFASESLAHLGDLNQSEINTVLQNLQGTRLEEIEDGVTLIQHRYESKKFIDEASNFLRKKLITQYNQSNR